MTGEAVLQRIGIEGLGAARSGHGEDFQRLLRYIAHMF